MSAASQDYVRTESAAEPIADELVVGRVLAGETALFEIIMRRYNQRLYRVARSIVRDDAQAEDIMQATYVSAYEHLSQFANRSSFGAWISRIAVNEALARLRQQKRYDEPIGEGDFMDSFASPAPDPEQNAANAETSRILEELIEGLPDASRTVFMLREVEGMSTGETSHVLGITEENVKVRLHRARALMRSSLEAHLSLGSRKAFQFHAVRCDAIVERVFAQILHS